MNITRGCSFVAPGSCPAVVEGVLALHLLAKAQESGSSSQLDEENSFDVFAGVGQEAYTTAGREPGATKKANPQAF